MKSPRRAVIVVVPALLLGVASAVSATATARPNLVVPSVTVTAPATVAHGGTFKVGARIKNAGTAPARDSRYAVLLSRDSVRNAGDVTVATGATPRLTAGHAMSLVRTVSVPSKVAYATYRVLVCADVKKVVAETHEGDDCRASATTVKVAAPAPQPDADHDGVPDSSDCAPNDPSLPPAGHLDVASCSRGVYALHANGGTGWAALDDVIVSAVDPAHARAFVQIKQGDPGYQTAADSAVEISTASVSATIAVGNRVTVGGMATTGTHGIVVAAETLDVVVAAELVPPFVVSPGDFATHAGQYDGLLVELQNQSIGTVANGAWTMAGTSSYDVTPSLSVLPGLGAGTSITTLVGIADTYDFSAEVWPRDASDVTPAP